MPPSNLEHWHLGNSTATNIVVAALQAGTGICYLTMGSSQRRYVPFAIALLWSSTVNATSDTYCPAVPHALLYEPGSATRIVIALYYTVLLRLTVYHRWRALVGCCLKIKLVATVFVTMQRQRYALPWCSPVLLNYPGWMVVRGGCPFQQQQSPLRWDMVLLTAVDKKNMSLLLKNSSLLMSQKKKKINWLRLALLMFWL